MKELEAYFRRTFEDTHLSSAERKALNKVLKEEPLTKRETQLLRSKIFDIARGGIDSNISLRILDWLEDANKLLIPDAQEPQKNQSYFSPGRECKAAILSNLGNAIHSVDICVFTISDDEISREIEFCHTRGVKVRILTDNDKLYDRGSDIQSLAQQGISVRIDKTDSHMHHKFAITDKHVLLTGSYNWTRSAARYNQENIIVTEDPTSVRAFTREFERLWQKMEVYHP